MSLAGDGGRLRRHMDLLPELALTFFGACLALVGALVGSSIGDRRVQRRWEAEQLERYRERVRHAYVDMLHVMRETMSAAERGSEADMKTRLRDLNDAVQMVAVLSTASVHMQAQRAHYSLSKYATSTSGVSERDHMRAAASDEIVKLHVLFREDLGAPE